MNFWSGFSSVFVASTISLVNVQSAFAQVIQITGIQFNRTSNGVEAILQTSSGVLPNIQPVTENQSLIFDIPNAQLNLPENIPPEQINPVPGIQRISLTTLDSNTVRLTIVGETNTPKGEYQLSPQGLVFSITPGAVASLEPEEIELVVTATRTAEDINKVPRSITVINREQLEIQSRITPDLGTTLSQLVPGLAPSTQSASNFGQSLRGRNILVIIDGVPQSTSRNVFRDLRTIDPSAIERIEVLRGPSAIYGDGATGGIVNITTRRPTNDKLTLRTEVGTSASFTNFSDSLGYFAQQSVSGNEGPIDYLVSATFSGTGGFFDAGGNRIPPDPNGQGGIADTNSMNFLGKVGWRPSENQRLEFSFNYFQDTQNTDFTTDPSVDEFPNRRRARALRGLNLDEQQATRNTQVNLQYRHDDLLGSKLQAQAYYRNYFTRFFPFDARDFAGFGNDIIQSRIESDKFGARVQVDTPLFNQGAARLLWGADYFFEDTVQPVSTFDEAAFDASGGLRYRKRGNRIWAPPIELSSLGLFAQFNWNINDRVILNGGLRYETAGINVDNYTTLSGNNIRGGNLDYNELLFNAGIVYFPIPEVNVFFNFSQGFSLADVGRVLRSASADLSIRDINPEPQKVNNFELGVRGQWRNIQASLSGFYNQSDLGSTFDADLNVIRAPEYIYGIEATIDTKLNDRWLLGGTLSWTEGRIDIGDDGSYTDLDGFRIPPLKLTAYVQHQTTSRWSNRLQFLYSGGRNPEGDGYGLEEVNNYFTADYLSIIKVGPGTLTIGVQNLFNSLYFPIVSQIQGINSSNAAAQGTTISVRYSFTW